ncbi:MAG: MFS transporter [Tissierellaceae bacterium]|nr:MFS transporter [Tissierellaceae bacterium]
MDKKITNHPNGLWTKDYILLLISNLLVYIAFYMLLTTLPYYVFATGGTNADVGMVTTVLAISAIVIRPFSGILLEKGDKKKLTIIGIIISILAIKSFTWAMTIMAIMAIRFVHGFGWGITTTTYGTISSDLVPMSRRGEGLGYFASSGTIAMSIGPPLGIMLIHSGNFASLFNTATIFTLVGLILIYLVNVPKIEIEVKRVPLAARLVEKTALFPSFLVLILGLTYGGITSFITLYGDEVGIANVGWFFTINAVFMFLIRPISGKVFDNKGPFWVLVPGILFSFLGVLLLSYVKSTSMLILSAIAYGIGFGTVQPSLLAWAVNMAAPERRGAANGTFFSAFDIGIGVGSAALGSLGEKMSYEMMYRLSSITVIIMLGFYLIHWYKGSSSS